LKEEQPTIDFAYASVVAIAQISKGQLLDDSLVWVKRPGTGEIIAYDLDKVLGKRSTRPIARGEQLRWSDVE
jgi:N-acetylneuraminate synthase